MLSTPNQIQGTAKKGKIALKMKFILARLTCGDLGVSALPLWPFKHECATIPVRFAISVLIFRTAVGASASLGFIMGGIFNTNAAKGSVWCFIYPSPTLFIHRLLLANVEIAPHAVLLRPVLFIVRVLLI